MREYVLIFCESPAREILLTKKDRPEWQRGLLNMPGGKIDDLDRQGTTLANQYAGRAAIRELEEETGLAGEVTAVLGKLFDEGPEKGSIIYCVGVILENHRQSIQPRAGETELPEWYPWWKALHNPYLIPNLRVIIPLCLAGVQGWSLWDDAAFQGKSHHGIKVEVPTY